MAANTRGFSGAQCVRVCVGTVLFFRRDLSQSNAAAAASLLLQTSAPDDQLLPVDQLIRIVNKAPARAQWGPTFHRSPHPSARKPVPSSGGPHRDHCLLADPTVDQSLANREPHYTFETLLLFVTRTSF